MGLTFLMQAAVNRTHVIWKSGQRGTLQIWPLAHGGLDAPAEPGAACARVHPSDITHHSSIAGELRPSSSLSPQHIWQTFKRWTLPPGTACSPYQRGRFAWGSHKFWFDLFFFFSFLQENQSFFYIDSITEDSSRLPVTLFMCTQFILFFYDVCTFKHDLVWVWDSRQTVTSVCQGSVFIPGRDSKEDWTNSNDRFGCSITTTIMKIKHKCFYMHRSAFIYLLCMRSFFNSSICFILTLQSIYFIIFSIFNVFPFFQCW